MSERLRMKDLVDQTGINKSTILHYIHMGLLPEPIRPSKNMAYYPPSYLTLLPIIRTLQSQYHMPLTAIKRILDHLGPNPSMERALQQYEFFYKTDVPSAADTLYNPAEFLDATGLSAKELADLLNHKLLVPLEEGQFNEDDRMMALVYRQLQEHRIPWGDLGEFVALTQQMAVASQRFYEKTTQNKNPEDQLAIAKLFSGNFRNFLIYLLRRNLRQVIQGDRP